MALSINVEAVDPVLRNAMKWLHSTNVDSAEKIRLSLDEIIKVRYGSSKMLINTLSKKHLAEEATASGVALKRTHSGEHKKSSKTTAPVPSDESATIEISDDGPVLLEMAEAIQDEDMEGEDQQLKELEELVCVICHTVDVSFRNRLVECSDCHMLYHQECHRPPISENDDTPENSWLCTLCKSKIVPPSPTPTSSSSNSSSSKSSSSSSHYSSKSYEKSHESSKSQKKSSKSSSSSSSNNNSKSSTPNINIISADKRLAHMKKKAAKLQETKRKNI